MKNNTILLTDPFMGRGGAGEHVPVLQQGDGLADGCLLLWIPVLPTEFAAVVESGSAGGGGGD